MKRLALLFLGTLAAQAAPLEPIQLDGEWRFALDAPDYGIREKPENWKFPDTIQLPGILTAQGFGNIPSFETQWTGETWRYPEMFVEWQKPDNFKFPFFLQPPRQYGGPAWYQREVDIPSAWKGHDVRVSLERVHWQSIAWIDGRKVGSANSLGTPHRFNLGPLTPGKHLLTLRIDNRLDKINVGPSAHSVSDQTQGNWNGVVGEMTLEALPANRIEQVDVYPQLDGHVKLVIRGTNSKAIQLRASCHEVGKSTAEPFVSARVTSHGKFQATLEGKVPFKPVAWSEFSPALYEISVSLNDDSPPFTTRFGFREIENRSGRLTLNGKAAFLRGTLECAIFPRLGHPPTEVEPWKRIIRICKSHGLNHIRFHSWCPPKAAFVAADELGFYYQVEASAWANGPAQIGSGRPVDAWVDAETERMRVEYGNHPSFLLMAYGNEPGGPNHAKWLANWVSRQQQIDGRRLYTTGAGWPVVKGSDFHNPFQPRIQRWGEGLNSILNAKAPQTDFDWSATVRKHSDAPVVSHEIGQWCAYPNFAEIKKYDGYFKARNFEIFRETARRNGLLDQAHDFLMASGKWQALCYKHDIEAALRTPGFGGFQLLDLHDFPGQGTALVGVLDAFWDEKGYITADEFHRFSSAIVPLARMKKMVFTQSETLEAKLELSHFGPHDLTQAIPKWKLSDGKQIVASGELPVRDLTAATLHDLGSIQVPLHAVPAPAKLTLTVSIEGHEASNFWDLFVYPDEVTQPTGDFITTTDLEETIAELEKGSKVLWLAEPKSIANDAERPIGIGFSPIFWNTAYTEWQPPHTLGLLMDPEHPALESFPTDLHTNWQWWEIVSRARPFILTPHHDLRPIVQPIDDWFTNRKLGLVFEAKIGAGRLLACSADLQSDLASRPAARQLKHSLESYIAGPGFNPTRPLQSDDLRKLVVKPPRILELNATVRASSEEKGYEAAKAIDGNPATFWHTQFSNKAAQPPHQIVVTFPQATMVKSIRFIQRQDGNLNGRLSEIEVLDEQGEPLATTQATQHADQFSLTLPDGTKTTQLTIHLPKVANGTHAAIAELDVVTSD